MARRPTPVLDRIVEKIGESRPVIAAAIEGLRNAARDPKTEMETAQVETKSAEHVAEAMAPIIANAGNNEPARASRVISGSTVAITAGLGEMLIQLGPMLQALETGLNSGGKWASLIGFALGGGAFGGGAFALFGRLRKALPPMTFKIWNPFSWFAPHPTTGA